ncbi:hypothetical protein [Jannaschia sp. 2305UL9-9]|uniref:hypothetical protein n=1 Tax=Jannaschia sp. 2305UL9-9 TaxID=3121638 RepID=UPI0035275E9D
MTDTAPKTGADTARPSRIVLHIGTHKTATTTIQDTFWENSALLAEHGVIYPRLGRVTGHHGLAYDWANLPPIYALEGGSRAALSALAAEYAHRPVTVFVSSEELSRGDPKGATDFAEVRALLSDFDEIEVVCTLRPQWEFLQSIYLEVSKYRSPPRPPQLIRAALETGMVEGLWVDYLRLLDQLEEVFAPEEITLLDFAAIRRAEGGVLGTFLRHLGVEGLTADDLVPVNGGASNVSPKPATSWAANILAEPNAAPPWLVELVSEAVDLEFPDDMRSCLFLREEFRKLEKHYAPLNKTLQERRAPHQPDFSLTPPDIEPLTVFRNTIPQSFWVRVGRRMTARMIQRGMT